MSIKALLLLALLSFPRMALAVESKIEVVCSFSIIDDLCHKILLDNGLSYSLIPVNGELHEYQLSAQDVIRLKRSKLVIGYSPESETWLDIWAKSSPGRRILWLGVREDGSAMPPHGWTDPILVKEMATRLCRELKRADPGLQIDQGPLLAEIDAVDARLKAMFDSLPEAQRKLITQHPNLDPLAKRYGLRVVGTLLASATGEAADTSAHHFSGLLKSIRSEQVRVIVTDEGGNQEMAHRLASDAKIPPPLVLNVESLSPPDGPAGSWKDMMLHNGSLLHRALTAR